MAKAMSGTGRVTVSPLLHLWPDTYGVIGYAAAGRFGVEAIVGYLPVPEVPDIHLMDVAARHSPHAADWVLCTGWSSRAVTKPGSLDLPEATWFLERDGSSQPNAAKGEGATLYGHSQLHVGRMSLADPEKPDTSAAAQEYTLRVARQVLRSRMPELVDA
ncbi:hypothetical protein AB0D04_20535 [Streptomyces sp. NPDC048483]|uniref:hypothetical protein n=1 Tax=Streptomyces sp. NPDC048483 TaxID=3154927 RepID=UPI00344A5C44